MELSNSIIKAFSYIANSNNSNSQSSNIIQYGTVKERSGEKYVIIDGSTQLTPAYTTADIVDGQRVTVTIENHRAVITGNLTDPASRLSETESAVSDASDALTKATTAEEKAESVEGIATEAKTDASDALTKATTAEEKAEEAEKYATNYISEDDDGTVTVTGKNATSSVEIGSTVKVLQDEKNYTEMTSGSFTINTYLSTPVKTYSASNIISPTNTSFGTNDIGLDISVGTSSTTFESDGYVNLHAKNSILQVVETTTHILNKNGVNIYGTIPDDDEYSTPLMLWNANDVTDPGIDVWATLKALTEPLNGLFKLWTPTFPSTTLASSGSSTVESSDAAPTGYYPIAFLRAWSGHATFALNGFKAKASDSYKCSISIRNISTASHTYTPGAIVLCLKESILS